MSGTLDPMTMMSAAAQGKFVPQMPQQAPSPLANAPSSAPAAVPAPTSPVPDPLAPGPPMPTDQPSGDPMAMMAAAANGQFKATVPVDTNAPNPTTPDAGPLAQIGSGLAQGAVGLPNALANLPIRGINALFGTKIPQFGNNPFPVQATSEGNRMLQQSGAAVGSLAPMMLGGATLEGATTADTAANLVGKNLANIPASSVPAVAAGGAAGQLASDNVPEPYKGLANIAGNLAGAGGEAGVQALAGHAAGSVADAASAGLGIGPKTSYTEGLPEGESVAATKSQAQFAVNKVRAAGGARLMQDLNKDPLQDAHNAISDKLDGTVPLEDGETPEDLKGAQAAIQTAMAARGSTLERVPGQQPTTSQVSPSAGMQSLEKTARMSPTGNYGATSFQAGDAAQNAAFVQHLENMSPGITSKLGDAFVEKATDLTNQQQQVQQSGQRMMQGVTSPITANTDPAVTGAAIREGGEAQHTAQKQSDTNDLWSQVPQDMQHSVAPAAEMARVLAGNMPLNIPNDASPELLAHAQAVSSHIINPAVENVPPQEQDVLQKVASLPATLPYQTTAKLLSTISTAKSQLAMQGMSGSPSMVRLRMIEGSLQDSMAGDFSKRLVGGEIPLVPQGSEQGLPALNAARAGTAETKQRFTRGVMGQVLDKGEYGSYKMPYLADVAHTVISGNASAPERMGEALDALKNDPAGTQALQDGLVSDANRRGIIKPDGTVDLQKYPTWMKQQQGVVAQFPGLTEKFQNAAAMQQMVDDANGQAVQAVKNYGNGIAKKFIGNDPGVAVQGALNAGDRGQQLGQMQDAVAGNLPAEEALKGHVINEVIKKFAPESGAPAGQDNAPIAAKSFRKFVGDYMPGLRKIFGGQGVQNFDMVRAGVQQAQEAKTAIGGSQTTPLSLLARANSMVGGHGGQGVGVGVMGLLGEHAAEAAGTHGLIGAGAAMGGTLVVNALKSAAIHNTQDLIGAMMRYPEFAKVMLQKLPPKATMTQALAQRMSDAIRVTGNSYLTRGLPTDQLQKEQ